MMEALESQLSYCERLRCYLLPKRCAERQAKAGRQARGEVLYGHFANNFDLKDTDYSMCLNCKGVEKMSERNYVGGIPQEDHQEPLEGVKTCKACKKAKPFGEFQHNPKTDDGYLNTCKACMSKKVGRPKAVEPKPDQEAQDDIEALKAERDHVEREWHSMYAQQARIEAECWRLRERFLELRDKLIELRLKEIEEQHETSGEEERVDTQEG